MKSLEHSHEPAAVSRLTARLEMASVVMGASEEFLRDKIAARERDPYALWHSTGNLSLRGEGSIETGVPGLRDARWWRKWLRDVNRTWNREPPGIVNPKAIPRN